MRLLMLMDIIQIVIHLLHMTLKNFLSILSLLLVQELINGLMLLLELLLVMEMLHETIIRELDLRFNNIRMDLGELLIIPTMI